MWLLNSGASTHFTYSKHDFIKYETIAPNERIAIRTASDTIYVEGKGAVLLEHYEHGHELVVTRLLSGITYTKDYHTSSFYGQIFTAGFACPRGFAQHLPV
jgi:hypothetical protein